MAVSRKLNRGHLVVSLLIVLLIGLCWGMVAALWRVPAALAVIAGTGAGAVIMLILHRWNWQ